MPMKILLIALSGIGDALMFTPALKKLKDEKPDSEIDALVMYKGVEDIYKNLPQISNVIYWDFLKKNKFKSLLFMLKLRNKYDAAINVYPSNRREYNLISLITGAHKRAAVEYLRLDFRNLGFLNNIRVKENDSLHNVEENIRMAEKLIEKKIDKIPPLLLNLSDDNLQFADEYFSERSINKDDLVIGFHPGCSTLKNHERRRWEPYKFAELGKRLIEDHNAKIFVFGGPEEDELKNDIVNRINLPGVENVRTKSLTQTAAIMKRCNVFITNDSSLMHVAAALQLNTIAIIGPTNKNYIHPWQTEHSIVSLNLECSPCFYYSPKPLTCSRNDVQFKCIRELSVELVYDSVEKQINSFRDSK